jgi:hypothetical protein
MLLTLDNLAHRYHCLPSEALDRATTFDLHVLDASAKYTNYQQEAAEEQSTGRKPQQKLSTQQMLDMIAQVRGQ